MADSIVKLGRKTGATITVEFDITKAGELQTGLSPTAVVYDEAGASFSTPTVSEVSLAGGGEGLYTVAFNPDAAGKWRLKVTESTIPYERIWSFDVVASDLIDSIDADVTTAISDIADVQTDTDDIQTRLPAALVGGRMDSDVGNIQTDAVDAAALATDAVSEIEAAVSAALLSAHGSGTWTTATGFATTAEIAAVQATADAVEADTQDIQTTLGSPAGASLAADIAAAKAVLDGLNDVSTADLAAAIAADPGLLRVVHRWTNRVDLDASDGSVTVYDDAGVAEFTGLAYSDVAQTTLYNGTAPVVSVTRLT